MIGTFFVILGVLSYSQCIETQDHPSDKTYHFPSASLTIAGDLKDVKLKGTIAQLVRALQQSSPPPSKPKEVVEAKPKTASGTKKRIHPSQLITKHNLHHYENKNGKKLYYGDPVPETITVSSQSVQVTQVNSTEGKRPRHLAAHEGTIDKHGEVKTVEGARSADTEEDQFYTWRQARVIKGFLVPNGQPANRHKKRQVIITDPQQYLAAAAAAQAHGATTIIDTSSMHRGSNGNNNANNDQSRASVFYAQEPAQLGANNNGAAIFASESSQQRYHPQATYHQQQQQQQQQHHHSVSNSGQTSGFGYTQQSPSSMYVLQDGNANAYNTHNNNANQAASSSSAHLQHHHHQAQLAQRQAQAQFLSRSGEAATAASASSQNSQQQSSQNVRQQQQVQQQQSLLTAAIKQEQYQPSLDTSAIQAAVEAVQQLEAQQAAAAVTGNQQQAISGQHQLSSQQQIGSGISPAQSQQQFPTAQQSVATQTVVIPQGASLLTAGGATTQEILAAAASGQQQVNAQYFQIQPSQEQNLLQLQQQQLQQEQSLQQQQQQFPAPNQFAERNAYPGVVGAAYQASPAQFVIQPQTYLAGAGGQTFTVPIPVPVEQAQQSQHHQQQQASPQNHQSQQARVHQQYNNNPYQQHQQQQQQHQYSGVNNHHGGNSNNRQVQQSQQGQFHNQPTIADRMKQAFNQNFNRKMLERVETNAVVPALASTGLFLGLSALAAGWYLSKSNREVGIVRRTGKFSKKTGSPGSGTVASDLKENNNEGTTNTRARRDLASMVTPSAYHHHPSAGGAPEVDQATFFQSIIQQSLEKTQKDYEDQVEPVYNPHQQQDNNDGPMAYHRGEPEPDRQAPPPNLPPPSRYRSKYNRYTERPQKYYNRDDDLYDPANSRISKGQIQEKSSGWSVHSAKNFARVAIPAIVLTGAALGICAVIFGWYISGDNREIAFLESPTTQSIGSGYHRKKRSLFNNTAWSDGWLIRTLKAIHGNPYDNMPAPTAKSFVPYPYFLEKDSSKTSGMEFKVSNNGLAGVLAGGAVLAVVALGLINSFTESSGRNLKSARFSHSLTSAGSSNSKTGTNPLTHLRSPRNMAHFENDLTYQQTVSNPSFLDGILSSLEASGNTVMNKLQGLGSSNWHQSSCTKRVLCQVITSQGDDTIRLMEKKMASIMKM